jgi:hypothetical protein
VIPQRDEDFDASYENLLTLAATIGDVRPRNTPDHVIDSLPSATFKEWRDAESDQRCPICLDDVSAQQLLQVFLPLKLNTPAVPRGRSSYETVRLFTLAA